MIKMNVYLNFNGKTEEVFNFYKQVFGGEFSSFNRYGEMPSGEHQMPEGESNLILHVSLPINDKDVLMGSDISEARGMKLVMGNNNSISLHPDTVDEGRRLYNELSAGGTVTMAYEKMFWGDYYASFSDKFGVYWMVNVHDG